MHQRTQLQYLFLILLALVSCATTESPQEPKERPAEDVGKSLIEQNRSVAEKIDQYAEKLDLYFAEDRFTHAKNKTTLSLHNPIKWREGGEVNFSPHFGLMLHLPNTQERFKIRFTSYDEDATETGINRHRYQEPQGDKSYGTSVEVIQELGDIETTFRPRAEWSNKLLTSYLLKFASTVEHSFWSFKPEFQLFARSDLGTGQFLSLNIHVLISDTNAIRIINEEQYADGNNTMTTNHGVELLHFYNERMEHLHSLIFQTANREIFHNEQAIARSEFRHKIRPEILHYSLTPTLIFKKERRFRPTTELNAGLSVIF